MKNVKKILAGERAYLQRLKTIIVEERTLIAERTRINKQLRELRQARKGLDTFLISEV